ncbi:hypothetical protein BHE74_00011824 [Ensete ventricosum]|nr:hypothetical protein GW17_00034368 [Ensete ventricosum]RWW79869.1 hypothetical protein BHE74_00011824 [Ensete ventricosum]RZR83581.1 hypothetical protein BHM03_00010202 [Ensete ventricosum]
MFSLIRSYASLQIAMANNTIIPSSTAVKFPDLEVSLSDGRCVKVPINAGQTVTDTSQMPASYVSLLCLSFRASSLVGYIFLLDGLGRIRWQGFGHATEEELSWLLSCTSLLLDEK